MKRRHFAFLTGMSLMGGFMQIPSESSANIDFSIYEDDIYISVESDEINVLDFNIDEFSVDIFNFETISEYIKLNIFATHDKTESEYKIYSQELEIDNATDTYDIDSLNSSTYDLLEYFNSDDLVPEEDNTEETIISIKIELEHPDIPTKEYIYDVKLTIENITETYDTIDDKNLLVHYPFREFTDSVISDESSNSYDGTNNGVENINESAIFDGDSYVSVPKESNEDISEELSISVWTKKDSESTLYSEIDNTDDYIILRDNSDYPDFRLSSDNTDVGIDFNENISTDEWVHIVATYSSSNGLKLYVNGNLDAEKSDNIGSLNAGIQSISIGRDGRDRRYVDGNMANFQIYSDELTSDDIDKLNEDKPFSIR